jgi:hypothetical protein
MKKGTFGKNRNFLDILTYMKYIYAKYAKILDLCHFPTVFFFVQKYQN